MVSRIQYLYCLKKHCNNKVRFAIIDIKKFTEKLLFCTVITLQKHTFQCYSELTDVLTQSCQRNTSAQLTVLNNISFFHFPSVPGLVPVLTASNAQRDSILLVWGPPLETNGVLTGYLLQFHLRKYTPCLLTVPVNKDLQDTNPVTLSMSGVPNTRWQCLTLNNTPQSVKAAVCCADNIELWFKSSQKCFYLRIP